MMIPEPTTNLLRAFMQARPPSPENTGILAQRFQRRRKRIQDRPVSGEQVPGTGEELTGRTANRQRNQICLPERAAKGSATAEPLAVHSQKPPSVTTEAENSTRSHRHPWDQTESPRFGP